jgi:isoquinoline 1-oxidoreductase beta subunit
MNSSRRSFVIGSSTIGAGLAFGFTIPLNANAAKSENLNQASQPELELGAWVLVKPDDTIVVRIARTEMGQGTLTGLAQLVADEMDVDWSKVTTELVSPQANLARKNAWGQMLTVGSFGIRFSQDYVRRGGAGARQMLMTAAAQQWGVPTSELVCSKGTIYHPNSKRSISYGKVADAAAKLSPPDPKSLTLKSPAEWKIIGKPLNRLDTAPKLNGSKTYGVDVRLPNMLNAAVIACPVIGGTIQSLDDSVAIKMPGVKKVVRIDDYAYAVIADSWWHANKASNAVKVVWNDSKYAGVSDKSIAAHLEDGLNAKEGLYEFRKEGDVAAALSKASKKVEATFFAPFLAHATMEPMNCTALVSSERAEIWVPTQDPEGAMLAMSKQAGLPMEKCFVNRYDPGGGFGRRGRVSDYVTQAVNIAQQMPGIPIKMIWSREEDMTHGQYRPISMCKMTASLDEQNRMTAMDVRLSGQSIYAWRNPNADLAGFKDDFQLQGWFKGADSDQQLCYTVPNLSIEYAMRNTSIPVGTWRGVNVPQNAFYMECFIEEVARAAKTDSVVFRKSLMPMQTRQLAMLDLAAEKGNWGKALPTGRHRGIAQFMSYGTYSAATAEVSVDPDGTVHVHRIVLALDCGYAVNPSQIEAQVQGSIVYGLSATLWGECTVEGGRIMQTNFNNYRVLRLAEMPKVETHIKPLMSGPWGGIGEPTIGVVAPAVVNAVSLAIGKPIHSLPLKNQKLV